MMGQCRFLYLQTVAKVRHLNQQRLLAAAKDPTDRRRFGTSTDDQVSDRMIWVAKNISPGDWIKTSAKAPKIRELRMQAVENAGKNLDTITTRAYKAATSAPINKECHASFLRQRSINCPRS